MFRDMAANFSTDRAAAINAFQFIHDSMLPSTMEVPGDTPSTFLGGGQLSPVIINGTAPTTDAARFVQELMTSGPTGTFITIQSPTQSPTVMRMKGAQAYAVFTDSAAFQGSTTNDSLLDVNMYKYITTGHASALILQKLYLIHDLFHVQNWGRFKDGETIFLQGFDLSGNLLQRIKIVDTVPNPIPASAYNVLTTTPTSGMVDPFVVLTDLMALGGEVFPILQISKQPHINTLVIRRLLYLWIRMANYRIAVLANVSGLSISKACYLLLSRANDNVAMTNNNPGNFSQEVFAGLAEKQSVMRATASIIADKNLEMSTYQKLATSAKDDIVTETKWRNKVRIFEFVALAVLAVVFIAAGILTGSMQMDTSNKIKASLGVFIITAFTVALILLVYNSKIVREGFAYSTGTSGAAYVNGTADQGFMNNVRTFVENTITVVSYLDSYDMAVNMNRAMFNDVDKYKNINNDLKVTDKRLADVTKYVDLKRVESNSRVYLFVTLTMILAVMLPIYVWAADRPSIRSWVMAVSGFIAFLALLIHAYESTSFVRTDGNKKYWGRPTAFDT